jgi:DNA-binding CsgD family transcriptional regulator
MKHALEALLPHVKTALQTRRILQGATVQSEFAELALEGVAAAVLLVSGDGNVLHMNKLASALVHKGDGLRLKGLSLTAWNTDDSARLSVLIARCASAQRNGLSPAPGGALEISRQETQHPLHVAVLPLPESSRSHIVVPSALVFISDPSISPKPRGDLLRAMYGLTPTESRLADLLLQGYEVRQTAEQMRNTLETTRFHLKQVFAKTGTRRQSELIRLMLSLPGE